MSMLCGVDFSSLAIHASIIPLDHDATDLPPVTLRSVKLPAWKPSTTSPSFRTVERCRAVPAAMRELLADVDGWPISLVCAETPFGASRKADNVMRELYGAILASIPPHIERDTITTQEWRRIVWPDGHTDGIDVKRAAIAEAAYYCGRVMNEHQAEAFLIARACRARLDKAFAA